MTDFKQLLRPSWLIKHAVVGGLFVLLVTLGFWQLDRLEQKRTHNANIEAALDGPSLVLDGSPLEDVADLTYRRVKVTGAFDNEQGIILRNQLLEGSSGVDLIVPFLIKGSDAAVLINRGWMPRDNQDPTPGSRRQYDLNGEITLEGILYQTQAYPGYGAVDPALKIGQARLDAWFRVDIDRMQEQLPYPVLSVYVEQLPLPGVGEYPVQDGQIDLDEGSHWNYAAQWFSFALILLLIYGSFISHELQEQKS